MSKSDEVSYLDDFDRVVSAHDQYRARDVKRRRIRSRLQCILDSEQQVRRSSGMKRLLHLRKTLDKMGLERTKMQRKFHNAFMRACALHIFQSDTEVDLARVMKLMKWTHLKQQVLCMTPRRCKCFSSLPLGNSSNIYLHSRKDHGRGTVLCCVCLLYSEY